ncbi:MAG: hypothetical protein COW00_10270 [Bdellovibrio sp. CG12_big_fil_rev_8_21_14_0_65_39_13]|nr:MAG: hypothetical protein COW78_01045 [Bdellovibrio sp. CG22_combo_CG10-13_8_21_14_all_39_27]PIQ59496.1 MAG: hypothetical protein COW00_10270 [Bdellovibrio sp. CG12_big_fil_rev_8_21_14_0_65_39_13]PIR33500.1 MAG: hypothetical protein COV37_16215 [Bdellovibrio sp. CG11_big_fil_rev_8_21_14_0_20_39_38]PJB54141.1 MAG: hypothetical protein CO099_03200 [Bdellovibrio sp. CG_4_9_14_3_um_filter_39_7]
MKLLLALALTLSAFSAHAGRVFNLESDTLNLGEISQSRGSSAIETFQIVRGRNTPDKIDMLFNFKETVNVCMEWDYRQVWRPGFPETVCHTDRRGNTHCTTINRGGYFETERYCVRYGETYDVTTKRIILDFDKARTLAADEKEVFEVTLFQKRETSTKVEARGTTVQGSAYEINYRTFLTKDRLVFKSK